MQPLWSNSAGECVMPIGGTSDTVTVANPGNQSTYQNSALSLYISGTSSGQHPLTWSATGLPAGLTIGPSGSGPGLISGQITRACRYLQGDRASDGLHRGVRVGPLHLDRDG